MFAVALVGGGGWAAWRVQQGSWGDNSLSALIPAENADPVGERALAEFSRRLERQVVFAVRHRDRELAEQAAGRVASALSRWSMLRTVRGRITPEARQAWVQFYAPHRQQLLSAGIRRLLQAGQGDAWRRQALALAYSPFGGIGVQELAADPFLLLRHFLLERVTTFGGASGGNGWQTRQDADGAWLVQVTGELTIDPFGINDSQAFVGQVEALEGRLQREFPGVELLRQGAVFHAAAGSRRAQFEVSTIGLGSTIGVVALNVLLFRHWIPLGVTLLSVAAGLTAAIAMTLWLTGPLHLFTLVFGSTLIGVAEDYSSHFLCHQLDRRAQGENGSTLQRILPAMLMSFATTVLAYSALLLAPFPVLRQFATFSMVGLAASFLVVLVWFPGLTRRVPARELPGGRLAPAWLALWRRSGSRRWLPVVVLALAAAPFSAMLHADDDVRQLQNLDPTLVRQEQTLAARFGAGGATELLLVRGQDAETLLQRLEAVAAALDQAHVRGGLTHYVSLSAFVPSVRQQHADYALVQQQLVRPWSRQQAADLGLKPGVTDSPFHMPFQPITAGTWLSQPVSDGLRLLWNDAGADGLFTVVPLRGVRDPEAMVRAVNGLPGVSYVNRARELTSNFKTYRVRIGWMLMVAVVLTAALVAARYGWRAALRIHAPCMVAALCALAMLRITGLPFNLFSTLALLLVLGMGIDYTLFFAESRQHGETTLLSVSLAGTTTILSFGLLAFSSTAAIANFGVVVFTGVLVSYLLAPLAMEPDA